MHMDITPFPRNSQMMLKSANSRILARNLLGKTQKGTESRLDFYNFCRNNGIY